MKMLQMNFAIALGFLMSSYLVAFQETSDAKQEQEKEETIKVTIADGEIEFQASKAWEKVEPRFSMIELEFAMKLGDDSDTEGNGRLTVMRSGGGVEANIQRWYGQFSQSGGESSEEVAEVKEMEIEGVPVHFVDISGDYRGGPGSSGATKKDYRMLAAIVEMDASGDYFIKFYGPKEIVDANAKRFKAFVKSMKIKGDF